MPELFYSFMTRKPQQLLVLTLMALLLQCTILGARCVGWADGPTYINWTTLNLNQNQESEIDRLETQWQHTYSDINPQIQRDKGELRRLLNSPQSDERQIMDVQSRIQNNEQRLRQEATRTFLNKKGQLNPGQKQRLQQMLGQ